MLVANNPLTKAAFFSNYFVAFESLIVNYIRYTFSDCSELVNTLKKFEVTLFDLDSRFDLDSSHLKENA